MIQVLPLLIFLFLKTFYTSISYFSTDYTFPNIYIFKIFETFIKLS